MPKRASLSAVLSLIGGPAAAQQAPTPALFGGGEILQMLAGFAFVLLLLIGALWLLRRLGPGQHSAHRLAKVVGAVSVGTRERVVLVEVGETLLVLGVAAGNVRTLHSLPKPDQPSSGTSEVPTARDGFGDMLDRLRGRTP